MTLLVITGFMGTGKTTVGRRVAQMLGWDFVDMDAEIAARASKTIGQIFAEEGEMAFRRQEAMLCNELCHRTQLVIATGGGTLLDPQSRALFLQKGIVVCLTCDTAVIAQRLTSNAPDTRPLLVGTNHALRLQQLSQVRAPIYAVLPWQIDTTHLSVARVAERIVHIARSVTLRVKHSAESYDIHIGKGVLSYVGSLLRVQDTPAGSRVAVVVNTTVAPLYYEDVAKSLCMVELVPFPCIIPDGETHKTLATATVVHEQLLKQGMERKDTVLALGGGVTGDLAGFVAATFMRGVRFVQLPTSLLAMVDASVGGKNGLNLATIKNVIGTFKQPRLVLIDPQVLATLPIPEIRAGMAELIKHSVVDAPDLFTELETITPEVTALLINSTWITRALQVKIALVEKDPLDQGVRAALNLGHTLGHALESLSHAELRHGEAVSIGMVAAARIGVALGLSVPNVIARLEALLSRWGLPTRCPPFGVSKILQMIAHDKKKQGAVNVWIIPCEIGKVLEYQAVPLHIIQSVLVDMGAKEVE